ncbi:MAG: hypothetical protein FJ384_03295, partial [Verrucomicrobia bacterium]|nr:hypothetical protein [Verrucomicrobiota bacterium]
MKNIHRSQLAWAAFALALAAGTLVAQDGDAAARKPMLLAEALKARDEGNLQVAKEKFEAILAIDPKDMGANEGLTSVNAALAEASAAKQAADAKAAAPAAAPAPAAAVAPAAPSALDEVATAHQNRLDEVARAIEAAKAKVAAGDLKRAQEILDGASGAIATIPTAAAQKFRDAIALAKQDLAVRREAGSAAAQEEVKRLAKENSAALAKQDDAIDAAEKLLRKGTAESVDQAISDLDAADRALGAESLSNKDLKERIKATKGSALARRALLAIEARDMTRANSLVADYAKLKGEDDPAVQRLQKELAAKRDNPTYRNIDELSPGVRVKDDKVNELLVKGRARYLYGDYQGALDAYREVLQYQPNNSESKAYQIRIRQMLSENSGQWNRGVTKGKLLELLDETWKLPEVFNRENIKADLGTGNDPVTEKMKTIRLPEGFVARDEPLDRALTKLSSLSQTYDKDQKGVNIVPVDLGGDSPSVNLQLRDVTVFQALDYLCKRVGYSFSVSPSGIVEVRKDAGDSLLDTQFFELTQAAVVKMTGQGLNTTAPGGASTNPFGGTGGAAGPTDGNPQEMAIKSFLTRSGVPFEAP